MVKTVNLEEMKKAAGEAFKGGYMCSETTVYVLNKYYELDMPDDVIAMSTGFPFGFGDGGNVCGSVAGATMCIGKVFGRTRMGDPKSQKCMDLTRELNNAVTAEYKTVICPELLEGYDFYTDERKAYCLNIVELVIETFAKIMERECGVTVK